MFKIADGRELLYQWDLDRQVIVDDPTVTEVHFCNRTDDCSLVTEVIDGKADVPNILLQSSFDIRVFGYDGKATLHEKTFKVKPRTRPADYVYEETEVLQWSTISARVDTLEENSGVYMLVLPEPGEVVTDKRTREILRVYFSPGPDYIFPLCSYRGNLILNFPTISGSTVILTAVAAATVSSANSFTEYDLVFAFDPDTKDIIFTKVTEYRRNHISKTSQLENDAEFTTKTYVDEAIANVEGGNVDLSDYYTKAETTQAIQDALSAIGVAEGGSY